MIRFSLKQNRCPTKPQKEIKKYNGLFKQLLLTHTELYDLDRIHALKYERFDKREMISYDKNIECEKEKVLKNKLWLLRDLQKYTINNKKSIQFKFNEYNGYNIVIDNVETVTYNYLKLDILLMCLVIKQE